jgi:putative ABC transport system substrate-binding protein
VKRRHFIAGLCNTTAARAQRMLHIGVLMNTSESEHAAQKYLAVWREALEGRNARIDTRWSGGDPERHRSYGAKLVALAPDTNLAVTTPAVVALQKTSRTVSIVFVGVVDPVVSGLVASAARAD